MLVIIVSALSLPFSALLCDTGVKTFQDSLANWLLFGSYQREALLGDVKRREGTSFCFQLLVAPLQVKEESYNFQLQLL